MFLNSKVVDNTLDLLTTSAYSSQQLFTVVRIELTPHVIDLSCGLPVILLTESGLCASFLYETCLHPQGFLFPIHYVTLLRQWTVEYVWRAKTLIHFLPHNFKLIYDALDEDTKQLMIVMILAQHLLREFT